LRAGTTWKGSSATTPSEASSAREPLLQLGNETLTTPAVTGQPRIASLDWVRGWMLIASVAVNSLWAVPEWFGHAQWAATHPEDVIFPIFVTLSGCGLAFAMQRTVRVMPLLRRVIILFLAGLLYNAIVLNSWTLENWRITGVLQLYAAVVIALGVLHVLTRSWVGWAAITAALAAAQTLVLALYASGCPGHLLTHACNPSGPLDMAVFGAHHIYGLGIPGHDPEGLVAVLGALVSASAGATIGHLLSLRTHTGQTTGKGARAAVFPVVTFAAALLIVAELAVIVPEWIWGVDIPMMKRLWTPPFALRIAAATSLALLAGHLLLDRRTVGAPLRTLSFPLLSLGRNSLLVYFGSHVLTSQLNRPLASGSTISTKAEDLITALPGFPNPQVTWTALILLFWISLACVLHRFKIYLRP